eukprot:gene10509-biopygen4055
MVGYNSSTSEGGGGQLDWGACVFDRGMFVPLPCFGACRAVMQKPPCPDEALKQGEAHNHVQVVTLPLHVRMLYANGFGVIIPNVIYFLLA